MTLICQNENLSFSGSAFLRIAPLIPFYSWFLSSYVSFHQFIQSLVSQTFFYICALPKTFSGLLCYLFIFLWTTSVNVSPCTPKLTLHFSNAWLAKKGEETQELHTKYALYDAPECSRALIGRKYIFLPRSTATGMLNELGCLLHWSVTLQVIFFFLVWQIFRYRIRGKIWLQCFRAFLQCALYLGDPVPISLLIINPLGNVRILSDNQVVADSAEETRPLLVFAHRDYIPLQVPLWTLTELPCRARTEAVSAWKASVEDLLILSTSFYLLSIISVCQISGRTKK